jgi:hypothetical protein
MTRLTNELWEGCMGIATEIKSDIYRLVSKNSGFIKEN